MLSVTSKQQQQNTPTKLTLRPILSPQSTYWFALRMWKNASHIHIHTKTQSVLLSYSGTRTVGGRPETPSGGGALQHAVRQSPRYASAPAGRWAEQSLSHAAGTTEAKIKQGSHFGRLLDFNLLGIRGRVWLGASGVRFLLFSLLFLLFLFGTHIPSRTSVRKFTEGKTRTKKSLYKINHWEECKLYLGGKKKKLG